MRRKDLAMCFSTAMRMSESLASSICVTRGVSGVERIEPFQPVVEGVTFRLPVELRRELRLAETQR